MRTLLNTPFGLVLLALLMSGVELFVWFYLYETGYLSELISSDGSKVSLVILLIYAVTTFYFLYICHQTSRQLYELNQGKSLHSRSLALRQFFQRVQQVSASADKKMLLEVLDTRIRSHYAFSFIVADLMLKLGILGTVIGFILMLGSLSNLNSIDITVMQTLLVEMSGGMKVALFTTLAGLIAGILLNIKFNLVDWAVDHLINDIRESMVE
jgi:hypothetical protein